MQAYLDGTKFTGYNVIKIACTTTNHQILTLPTFTFSCFEAISPSIIPAKFFAIRYIIPCVKSEHVVKWRCFISSNKGMASFFLVKYGLASKQRMSSLKEALFTIVCVAVILLQKY